MIKEIYDNLNKNFIIKDYGMPKSRYSSLLLDDDLTLSIDPYYAILGEEEALILEVCSDTNNFWELSFVYNFTYDRIEMVTVIDCKEVIIVYDSDLTYENYFSYELLYPNKILKYDTLMSLFKLTDTVLKYNQLYYKNNYEEYETFVISKLTDEPNDTENPSIHFYMDWSKGFSSLDEINTYKQTYNNIIAIINEYMMK